MQTNSLAFYLRFRTKPAGSLCSLLHVHVIRRPEYFAAGRVRCSTRSQMNGAPVFVVHIRHAGGSSVCSLALANGLRAPSRGNESKDMSGWFSKNCNPRYHDREAALGHLGKPAMLHYARSLPGAGHDNGGAIWATEWAAPTIAVLPWSEIAVIALVRNPTRQVVALCARDPNPRALDMMLFGAATTRPGCWVHSRAALFNFQTRRYAGCARSFEFCLRYADHSAAEATAVDLARAIAFLNRATVVLITERFNEAGPVLRRLLGWTRTELPRENAFSTEHEVGRGRGSVIPSETVQAALRNLSALDFLLHDHAMVRFEADLVLAAG